jgi:hypothetical protein
MPRLENNWQGNVTVHSRLDGMGMSHLALFYVILGTFIGLDHFTPDENYDQMKIEGSR